MKKKNCTNRQYKKPTKKQRNENKNKKQKQTNEQL